MSRCIPDTHVKRDLCSQKETYTREKNLFLAETSHSIEGGEDA